MKNIILFLSVVAIFVSSCKGNKQKEDATKTVNEWIGKEIKFPENVSCYFSGKDTIPELCGELFKKIIRYCYMSIRQDAANVV